MNPTNYLNCYPISEATSFGYRTTSILPSRGAITTSVAGVNNSSFYYNSPVIPEAITSPPFFSPLPHPLSFYTTCRPPFSAKSLGGVHQLQQPQQQGPDEAAAVLLSLRQPVVRQGEEVPVFSFPMSQASTDVKSTPSTPQLGSSLLYKPATKSDLCQETSGSSASSRQEYCSYHLPSFSSLPAAYDPVFSRPMTAPYFLHNQGFLKANICYICGKSYARPSTLRTHLRTHSGEKPYQCSMCLKSFTQAANLTAHLRTHSGEKPFKCPVCERRFSQSSSVTTHMRTHSGERPYKCTVCSKAFADSSTLTKHFRTHSGEKPYQCKVCDAAFSQSGNLNRHMKIHRPRESAATQPTTTTTTTTSSSSKDTATQVKQTQ